MERKDDVGERSSDSVAVESIREKASGDTQEEARDRMWEHELPDGIKDVMRRLDASSSTGHEVMGMSGRDKSSIIDFSWILRDKNFEFLMKQGDESPKRTEARLKVLEALGSCQTFRWFNLRVKRKWNWSMHEWKALLVPLQTIAVQLEKIVVCMEGSSEEDQINPLWSKIFRQAHNLRDLKLEGKISPELAAEVASGLRENSDQKLKSLFVDLEDGDAEVGVQVAEIISYAPHLEKLTLGPGCAFDASAREALSATLKRCGNLRLIQMWYGTWEVLADAYTESNVNPVLELLEVRGEATFWQNQNSRPVEFPDVMAALGVLGRLIRGNIRTIRFDWASSEKLASIVLEHNLGCEGLGQSLLYPSSLKAFQMNFHVNTINKCVYIFLSKLWRAAHNSPLLDISFFGEFNYGNVKRNLRFVRKALSDTYLKRIDVDFRNVVEDHFRSFVDALVSNTSVNFLQIDLEKFSEDTWTYFFNHLRDNSSIKTLKFQSDLHDENFRHLMDLLQVNFIIEEIDVRGTSWAIDGKKALIDEALERNKRQAGYLSVLQRQNLPFGGAKAGRIFLCGLPFAGKTQLKVTMIKTRSTKSTSESIVQTVTEKLKLGRTKGIEVELLCDNDAETISIWDLAGQDIFRALQNLLFPRISQACVFCFVFNPFEVEDKSKKLKKKLDEAFFTELRSWLRFVASVQLTGRILPQMLVIVTHKDKLNKREKEYVPKCIEKCSKELREKYKGVIDLCPTANNANADLVYFVNATSKKDVARIKYLILSCMRNVLKTKSPRVPKACSQLVSRMLQRGGVVEPKACCQLVSRKLQRRGVVERPPVLPCEEFYRFCSTQNPLLENFDSAEETGREVLHAAASYLHDTGAVFMTPSARRGVSDVSSRDLKKSVVVDLNWLTQNLLGELVSHGHGFETKFGPLSLRQSDCGPSSSWQSDSNSQDDGFIDPTVLYARIQRILEKQNGVDIAIVEELLFELDLCYRIKSEKGPEKYFMPMIFGIKNGTAPEFLLTNKLSWVVQETSSGQEHWPSGHHHSSLGQQQEASSRQELHFGFRVQCHDNEKTAFNHGFYPRFQIHLRRHMDTLGVLEENFLFSRYHVKITINGYIIFVEIDPSGENHVDIMVQFEKEKTRDGAMDYVQENVVQKLIKFSASEDGCPAVQLNVAVLRTQCVERLIPRTLRGESQAVPIDELKRRFKADIVSQVQKGEKDDKLLFGYMHAWPKIKSDDPCCRLAGLSERAQTLLSSKDFDDVLVDVEKTHQDLRKNLNEIQEVSWQLSDLQNLLNRPEGNSESTSALQESSTQRKQEHLWTPGATLANMGDADRVIHDKLVHLGEKMDDLGEKMNQVKVEVKIGFEQVRNDFRSFKSTMDEMLSQMSRVESTVDTIIGYTRSKDIHRTPNRPYFRFDVRVKHKVTGALLFGKPVRLHLMCEAKGKPHIVKDQEGLELLFEKEDKFSRSMRTLSVVSMKMIWVLLKIGAQVAAGSGNAIPDISCLASFGVRVGAAAANIALDSETVKREMEKNLPYPEDAKVDDAWCCLRDHLAEKLTAETYASLFKLHSVRYKNIKDPDAWLCPSCVSNGRRNFLLEP